MIYTREVNNVKFFLFSLNKMFKKLLQKLKFIENYHLLFVHTELIIN